MAVLAFTVADGLIVEINILCRSAPAGRPRRRALTDSGR
jgi:hypothetical protein